MITETDILKKMQKPVGVLGAEVTGKAIGKFLENLGVSTKFYTQNAPHFFLEDCSLWEHDLYIISPGFASDHLWVKKIREANILCLAELDFARVFWKGILVAITGTNGKTTTTAFINQVLKNSGHQSYAVGNIGTPFCEILASNRENTSAYAICEVSSFQAEQIQQFLPDYVIWTNFSCDHLDRHKTIETYFSTKLGLLKQSTNKAFIGKEVADFLVTSRRTVPKFCEVVDRSTYPLSIPLDSPFAYPPQEENYRIAYRLLAELGVSEKKIEKSATQFRLPPHRLRKIMDWEGIRFWNDSKATNWGATISALQRFTKPVHWIGGGSSKGEDSEEPLSNVKNRIQFAYLIGEVSDKLLVRCQTLRIPAKQFLDLENAFKTCLKNATAGDTILFSPGFASLDQFKNYAHRGNCFEKLVLGLKKEAPRVYN